MNFLTPLAFLGALLAIPVILLYMLRLRRREVTISSTFLWQQILQDREANTPWQRLRRNLLLILQLIILILLVLALARPFMTVPAVSAGQVTILLDASASMNADDINNNTRFERAKSEALDIVDTLSSEDRLTVIRVAEVPEALVSRSVDRGDARDAIADAQPSLTQSDWEAALNLAAAGGAGSEDFTIVIISDGGLPNTSGLPGINGEVRYIPVGESSENVAITALATGSLPGEIPELYAQITNYGDTESVMVFTLLADEQRLEAETLTIPANQSVSFVRPLPENFTTLRATLTESVNSPAPDHLQVDNTAYAIIGEGGTRRVLLVTDGNRFLEQALLSTPGLEVVRTDGSTGIPPGYDTYIFDSIVATEVPDGDLFFINPSRGLPGIFSLGAEIESETNAPSANTSDPRLQYVDVRPIYVVEYREVLGADWADELITLDDSPLLLAGEVAGRQVAILPFDPVRQSNLALDIAWPLMIVNLMEWFTPRTTITVTDSLSVGESLLIRPPFEADSIRVTPPEGEARTLPVDRESVVFAGTNRPGIYQLEVLQADEVLSQQSFAVNLFSPLESRISPVGLNDLTLQGVTIATEENEELGQREFWPIIVALALLILLLEWYAYHRRMRVPSVFSPLRRRATAVT